jgi:hypothetical protein
MSVTFFSPFLSIIKEGRTYIFKQDDTTADTANYVFENRTKSWVMWLQVPQT